MLIVPASKVSVPLPVNMRKISNAPDKVTETLPIVATVAAVLPDEVPTQVFPLNFDQTTVLTQIFAALVVAATTKLVVASVTATAAALVRVVVFPE
jgi:hypothetical protein